MCVDDKSTSNAGEASGMMWPSDEILDALDTRCVPDELVVAWTLKEEEVWRSLKGCQVWSLPLHVREAALSFLRHILSKSGLEHTAIFAAVTLLDLYVMKSQASKIIEDLPATCAVLARLVIKADLGVLPQQGAPCDFSSDVRGFADWLQSNGFAQVGSHAANTVDINSQEAFVVERLGWRVNIPTCESWISVFVSRLDVLTQYRFSHALTCAGRLSMSSACFMMAKQALSRDMPPKRMAVGVFCLSLACVDVVSFDLIRPSTLGSEQWTQVLLEARFDSRAVERTLHGAQLNALSRFLTWATGESIASTAEHCHAIALAMRWIAHGTDNMSRAQHASI